ncbi:MAG: YraN family protein, partial [Eubacteriales bacterium]
TILERNWRCRYGEIDLIAERGDQLVLVEVKLRKNKRFGNAYEAVDIHKQRKLTLAGESYLAEHPTPHQVRFDVVSLYAPQGMETEHPVIEYLENAF